MCVCVCVGVGGWVGVCKDDKDELWMMRSTGYVAHMGKKGNMYRVLVGIAEEWRLLKCRCNGKIIIVIWIGKM